MSQPMEAPWIIIESDFNNNHLQRIFPHLDHWEGSYKKSPFAINSYMPKPIALCLISKSIHHRRSITIKIAKTSFLME